jgi:hypothetical protein
LEPATQIIQPVSSAKTGAHPVLPAGSGQPIRSIRFSASRP